LAFNVTPLTACAGLGGRVVEEVDDFRRGGCCSLDVHAPKTAQNREKRTYINGLREVLPAQDRRCLALLGALGAASRTMEECKIVQLAGFCACMTIAIEVSTFMEYIYNDK
jgi:hypothetical protein